MERSSWTAILHFSLLLLLFIIFFSSSSSFFFSGFLQFLCLLKLFFLQHTRSISVKPKKKESQKALNLDDAGHKSHFWTTKNDRLITGFSHLAGTFLLSTIDRFFQCETQKPLVWIALTESQRDSFDFFWLLLSFFLVSFNAFRFLFWFFRLLSHQAVRQAVRQTDSLIKHSNSRLKVNVVAIAFQRLHALQLLNQLIEASWRFAMSKTYKTSLKVCGL